MNPEPRFLTLAEVYVLQYHSLEKFGGLAGVRDEGTFEAAVMQPQNIWSYESADLFEIAAGYAFHIAQAQALVDGNKRTGIASALVFLELNGWTVPTATDELYRLVIGFADRSTTRKDLAQFFRTHALRETPPAGP